MSEKSKMTRREMLQPAVLLAAAQPAHAALALG
jgi:hypothetical protein